MIAREHWPDIYLLSDRTLYAEALAFIQEQGTVEGQAQMTSLAAYTQSWNDLMGFVRHQSRRDWTGRKAHYKEFYTALEGYLNKLRQRVTDWFPPDPAATKNEKRAWIESYALAVGREFVQHLVAENLYREKFEK